jgi:alpha-1,2-mannosyltransferase
MLVCSIFFSIDAHFVATGNNPNSWLTARRLRGHASLLAACLWVLYAWNLATPGLRDRNGNLKGTDFLHFYTLGSLAAAHRGGDLYDMNVQAQLAGQRVPEAAGLRYLPLYPPQVSIFFAPLSYLPYGWALVVWWSLSAIAYGICCFFIWKVCPNLSGNGGTVFVAAVAYPAFLNLIAWGQTSAMALACFTGMFFLLRAKRNFAAGLVLGCLIFKPQLGLAAAAVFVLTGAWSTVVGGALSALAQLGLGVFYYGFEPLRQWMRTLTNVRALMPLLEPKPYQTHSLRTFWSMMMPSPNLALGLYVLSALAVLGLTLAIWRPARSAPLALRYSALLLTTVLVAPHLTVYDLVILAPIFLLLADWMAGQTGDSAPRWLGPLLYMIYALPLLVSVVRWMHVQFSVIAMSVCVYVIWSAACAGSHATSADIAPPDEGGRGSKKD